MVVSVADQASNLINVIINVNVIIIIINVKNNKCIISNGLIEHKLIPEAKTTNNSRTPGYK